MMTAQNAELSSWSLEDQTDQDVNNTLVDKTEPTEIEEAYNMPLIESQVEPIESASEEADEDGKDDHITTASRKSATSDAMLSDPVRQYLREIARTPLLTAEEEVDKSKRIEVGVYVSRLLKLATATDFEIDPALQDELRILVEEGTLAKAQMMTGNLRLVVSIAKRYVGRNMDFLDLIQEGNIGLNRAINKFDYAKGYKFSTYATWWIRQAITRAIADQSNTIRYPVHVYEMIRKMTRREVNLMNELGRQPTELELAESLDIKLAAVKKMKEDLRRQPISLETPVDSSGSSNMRGESVLSDYIEDTSTIDPEVVVFMSQRKKAIRKALEAAQLKEDDIEILMRRNGSSGRVETLEEIANDYGVSRERIRQREYQILEKLRKPAIKRKLEDYRTDIHAGEI
jgi:RNA polymerase sigma factor (sigma-70 family)